MRNLNQTGLLAGNILSSFPSTGNMSVTMPDNFEDLSREQLIARLNNSNSQPVIHDNSMAALLMSNSKEAPGRYWKMLHPATKFFFAILAIFWISLALFVAVKLF